jgi:hypothetical protein
MSYDSQQFYNSASAIVLGMGIGVASFRLLPLLSPAFRTHRLLTLTLRELRRLATGPIPRTTLTGKAASTIALPCCPTRPNHCSARSF